MGTLLPLTAMKAKTLVIASTMALGLLTGCSTSQPYESQPTSYSAFAMDDLLTCADQAASIETTASSQKMPAQYLSAANQLSACLNEYLLNTPYDESVGVMQLQARVIFNFVKGGNIASAQDALHEFQVQFPYSDLFLPDNTSFVDTASLLLGVAPLQAEDGTMLNVNPVLRSELNRVQYWQQH